MPCNPEESEGKLPLVENIRKQFTEPLRLRGEIDFGQQLFPIKNSAEEFEDDHRGG